MTTLTDLPLLTPWWLIGFGLVSLLFLIWALARKRRKRRGFVFLLIVAIVFLVIAGLFGTNMALGRYPTVYALIHNQPADFNFDQESANPSPGQGSLQTANIPGNSSGVGSFPADVWLPPQYFSDKGARFPIIYLYPGEPGSYQDWFGSDNANQTALAAANAGKPVIVIAPTVAPTPTKDSECVNGAAGNWETYLSVDVTGWVAENFGSRIKPGAEHAAVGGLSMGGYCAQMMALKHPSQFSAFGNISGTTQPTFDGGMAALFGPVPNLSQTVNSYTSTWIIANQPPSNSVKSWIAIGNSDAASLKADQALYVAQAQARGMKVTTQSFSGGHSPNVWQEGFQSWLSWVYPFIK